MQKLLIANRGEIAVRIIRACRDLGIATVAVYSECDRAARHVRMADEAVAIGESPAGESYLRADRLLDAARAAGADALHPGYGFLAENAAFAAACVDAGLTFVGPTPAAITLMGSKTAARAAARRARVPVVPGSTDPLGPDASEAELADTARRTGYPLMVKAVAGGGGRGLRLAETSGDLAGAVRLARSEAASAFGDAAIYFERRLSRPRHIEVQVLGDTHGTVLPFVERECSVQRRHQKVIEESPSPVVQPSLRRRLTRAAAAVASSVGYTNAGTVEFLLDGDGRFYFLEMNTRLQVEHPITELVTGVDLVTWQLRIARGERLDLPARDLLLPRGHALECRIYAEDPDAGFLPSPGRIDGLRLPEGPGVRVDSGVDPGSEIPVFYDALVAKLIAWGASRTDAIARMTRALDECEVRGIPTTLPFFRWFVREPAFVTADFHTEYLDTLLQSRAGEAFDGGGLSRAEVASVAAALRTALAAGDGAVSPARGDRRDLRGAARAPARRGWKASARIEGLRG